MRVQLHTALDIFWVFFRISSIVFGGPAAHVSMFEQELVRRRKWLTAEEFLDLVGATNLVPGPNSTEIAMHCGYKRGGILGLVAAGVGFILPAASITLLLAWAYVRYGRLPAIEPFLYGIKPAVLGVIVPSLVVLTKKGLKNVELGIIGGLTLIAALFGVGEVMAILGAGVLGFLWYVLKRTNNGATLNSVLPFMLVQGATWGAKLAVGNLFGVFFKVGALLFGSGLVLMAYLEDELVQQRGWLTMEQLVEAIAIGQFTPGPILSTATFIGYQLLGFKGAVAATVGIFLPSFFYAGLLNYLLHVLKRSDHWRAFLDAVNIAAVAVMAAVTLRMTSYFAADIGFFVLGTLSLGIAFLKPKLHPGFLILGGAAAGWLWHMVTSLPSFVH